jgi:putative SOS response-associated peptidase YedK
MDHLGRGRKEGLWLLRMPGGEGFSFAGLWARNDTLGVTSCTIITAPCSGRDRAHPFPDADHLPREVYRAWLDTDLKGDDAKPLVGSQIDSMLSFHRVARDVNNSRYEGTDTKVPLVNSL